jgi:hypothetical protein
MSQKIVPQFAGVYPPGSPMQRLISEADALSEPHNTLFPSFAITPAEVRDYLEDEAEGIVVDAAKTIDMFVKQLVYDLGTLLYATHVNRADIGDIDREELAYVIREAVDGLIPRYGWLLTEWNSRRHAADCG